MMGKATLDDAKSDEDDAKSDTGKNVETDVLDNPLATAAVV